MRHFLLRHHQQKKIFLKRNMYIKDIERTHEQWYGKNCSKSFSDASNSQISKKGLLNKETC